MLALRYPGRSRPGALPATRNLPLKATLTGATMRPEQKVPLMLVSVLMLVALAMLVQPPVQVSAGVFEDLAVAGVAFG